MTFSNLGARHSLRQRWMLGLGLMVGLTLASSSAAADAVPPDVMACDRQEVGASCLSAGVTGECAAARCTRLDYAGWDRDASMSPPPVEYDCIRCETAASGEDAGPRNPGSAGDCSASPGRGGAGWLMGLFGAALLLSRRARR